MNTPNDSQPPLVAIVDDEEDITTYLGLALEDAGYRVVTTNESATALQILQHDPPDLICLDLLMPHRTGASLYFAIRRDPRLAEIPVLILSGLNVRDELNDILQLEGGPAPPAGYLEKPLEQQLFLATVQQLLGQRGPRREGVQT